jgi:VanZ family protein
VTARGGVFTALVALSLVVLFAPTTGTPPLLPGLDKAVHLVLFAALAVTGRWAGLRPLALVAGLVVYAGASEVLQGVLPLGRSADPVDALTDVVGIAIGIAVAGRLAVRDRRS